MLYFGRVGSSWGHQVFFGSSWGEKVITPYYFKVSNVLSCALNMVFLVVYLNNKTCRYDTQLKSHVL
jgi:hypothetical protein